MPYTAEEMHYFTKLEEPETAVEAFHAEEARRCASIAEQCAQLADEAAGVPHGSRTEVSKAGAAIRRHFGLQHPAIPKPLPEQPKASDNPIDPWKVELAHRAKQAALTHPERRNFGMGTLISDGVSHSFTFDTSFIRHSTTADIIEAIDSMLKKGA